MCAAVIVFYFPKFVRNPTIRFENSVVEQFLVICVAQFKCYFTDAMTDFGFRVLIYQGNVRLVQNIIAETRLTRGHSALLTQLQVPLPVAEGESNIFLLSEFIIDFIFGRKL